MSKLAQIAMSALMDIFISIKFILNVNILYPAVIRAYKLTMKIGWMEIIFKNKWINGEAEVVK